MYLGTSVEFVALSSRRVKETEKRIISITAKTKLSIFKSTVVILTRKNKLKALSFYFFKLKNIIICYHHVTCKHAYVRKN